MIDRSEILAVAGDLSLTPDVIEKDYVLGWVLAGIYAHRGLAPTWTFKGGTCLRKCYILSPALNGEHKAEQEGERCFPAGAGP